MEDIKHELEQLNRNWWQRGDEESFIKAKAFDRSHPKLKNKAIKEWQDMSLRYSVFCLRIIGFIKTCPIHQRKELAKLIKEEIKEEGLLEILRIAWKETI